jgi:hypothetical protein
MPPISPSGIPLPSLSAVFTVIASLLPHWPDDSAIGVNVGIDPAKAGLSAFYAQGDNQWNLGMMYGHAGVGEYDSDIRVGLMYNRRLTDWGLFAATGLHATYSISTGPTLPDGPEYPETPTGTAWRSRGFRDPEWMLAIGEDYWFGETDRFGIYADLGAGYALPTYIVDKWQAYIGAGVSYRFQVN